MIKAIKRIIPFSIISIFFINCNLDYIPKNVLSDKSFWKSEDNLKDACNYLYTFLPNLAMNDDAMSDNAFGQVGDDLNKISAGTRIAPTSSSDEYNEFYQLIRAANNIIEKASKAKEFQVEQNVINRYLAEARFFRAWGYFQLVKRYGDVPMIMKTLNINSKELNNPATSAEIIYDSIYTDLDFASSNLPTASELGSGGYGRISRGAALSFKARVALFEGTREKFHQYGDPDKHLKMAVSASNEVIESQEYELYPNYFDVFQPEGNGYQNHENILVHQYGVGPNNVVLKHPTNIWGAINGGESSPTKSLVDSYLMMDGLPIEKSPLYSKPVISTDIFKNRDPRLDATVFKIGDPFVIEGGFGPFYRAYSLLNSQVRTGYMQRKFFNRLDYNINPGSYNDFPIIRYAEVLLIYAEATYEFNGYITDQQLDKSINLLRDRVNMPHLTNEFVKRNGLEMRHMIRRERRDELALEGFRYWDLIRWRTAENILPKAVLGSYYFDDLFANATVKYNLTQDSIIIVQEASVRKFDPNKDYLWPIPIDQLALNPNLNQNPGW